MTEETVAYTAATPPATDPPEAPPTTQHIQVVYNAEGEAAVTLEGVSPQQVLTAGALLTTMGQHLLNARFVAAEQQQLRQLREQAQQQEMIRRVTQDLQQGR